MSISNFWISGQSFVNKNCHNSRTSHDIDIKLKPVTKIHKRNTKSSKKFNGDVMSRDCKVIVFFPNLWLICSHSEAGFRMYGLQILIKNKLLSCKN